MARKKLTRVVLEYVGTPYIVEDCGENESPRFLLKNTKNNKIEMKSDNPLDFDKFVYKK